VTDVAIIDSGGANIASLRFALERLGATAQLTADRGALLAAPRVILPGVGAAADAMTRLHALGLVDLIPQLQQPVLGICLGMQLLFAASEEGLDGATTDCLGIIAGRVVRLQGRADLPVPHMGWNQLHSYAASAGPWTVATADYGGELSAAVQLRNFHGVQFHPERSARAGARVLANFLELS
jgi:glutamine amidotransferase